jgi:hypothetical protein
MKRVALTGLVSLAAIVIAAAATLAPVTLKRTPVKGQKLSYTMTGKITIAGMEGEISSKEVDTITDVAADGNYTTETLQSDLEFNGSPVPQQASGPSKSVNKPTGEIVSFTGPDGGTDQAKMAAFTSFYYPTKPVEVNDTWTYEAKKDDKLGTPEFKAEMKYLGEEKVGSIDTYKIQEETKESTATMPATISSTVWIDKADGAMVKVTAKFSNLPVTQGLTMDGTTTITRS